MNALFSPDDDFIRRIHDTLTHLADISTQAATAPLLSRPQLSAILETAFWASLQTNEGRPTRVCLAVAAPDALLDAAAFDPPLPCDDLHIAKLAPAVPPGGCLAIHPTPPPTSATPPTTPGFSIWGFGRSQPVETLALLIDIAQPGTLRIGLGPFQPFALLSGQSRQIIESTRMKLASYLKQVLKKNRPSGDYLEISASWQECLALRNLAQLILASGHGGTLLILPDDSPSAAPWRQSLNPFPFQFALPDRSIPDGIRRETRLTLDQDKFLQQLARASLPEDLLTLITNQTLQFQQSRPRFSERDLRALAALAAVDGAVVLTRDLSVLGFGAKISLHATATPDVYLQHSEPGTRQAARVPLESIGGTRHQSAARFVFAHPDAVAIVLSQDHHLSVMHWDNSQSAIAVIRDL